MESGRQTKRSRAERRRIVEETLRPGTSVATVARAHGVNANQVFAWRKLYREGLLNDEAGSALVPVKVAELPIKVPGPMKARQRAKRTAGVIDIDLGHARLRIEGSADPDCVRAAVEGLLR